MMGWLMFLHVFGAVLWIAGVLAADRIMIDHAALEEAHPARQEAVRRIFEILERKFLTRMAYPGMGLAVIGGLGLYAMNPAYYWGETWMRAKLSLVALFLVATAVLAKARRDIKLSPAASRRTLWRWHRLFVAATVLILFFLFVKPV